MKKQFLECGKIVTTHGIRGDVRVQAWCDSPEDLLELKTLYLQKGQRAMEVERARLHKSLVLVKFAGIDTPEQADTLRGQILWISRDDLKLEDGECFVQDLIGCRVVDADTGADYGSIYDVRATGANDVYYLRDAAGVERLVPAIADVVLSKDVDAGVVTIRPLEGLFDAN